MYFSRVLPLLLPVGLYVVRGEVQTDEGKDCVQRVLSLVY